MTFIYPAVFTPHKEDEGYHAYFPDLEGCEADGPDLEIRWNMQRKQLITGFVWS